MYHELCRPSANSRCSSRSSTKPHGTGLGLAVCRTIVTAHGGRLFAEHADRGRATFVLELRPAADARVTHPHSEHAPLTLPVRSCISVATSSWVHVGRG